MNDENNFNSDDNIWLQDLIREVDPDIIIGYNICKFDLPYLIEVFIPMYLVYEIWSSLQYSFSCEEFFMTEKYLFVVVDMVTSSQMSSMLFFCSIY